MAGSLKVHTHLADGLVVSLATLLSFLASGCVFPVPISLPESDANASDDETSRSTSTTSTSDDTADETSPSKPLLEVNTSIPTALDESPIAPSQIPSLSPGRYESFTDAEWAKGGISIAKVELNQAVPIPLFKRDDKGVGTHVASSDRNAPAIAMRHGLVRAYWNVPQDWEPRKISARLILQTEAGWLSWDVETLVDGDSSPDSLEKTFSWKLEPEDIRPFMDYRIELREVSGATVTSAASEEEPAVGFAELGTDDTPNRLNLTLVAVGYEQGDQCATGPEDLPFADEEIFSKYLKALYEMTPIEHGGIDWSIRGTGLVWTDFVSSIGVPYKHIELMRAEDDAGPHQFYVGMMNLDCQDPSYCCHGGEAWSRVCMVRYSPELRTENWNHQLFVHEITHMFGLGHMPGCGAGGATGNETATQDEHAHAGGNENVSCSWSRSPIGERAPDTSYPYPAATIGFEDQWGYRVIDEQLIDPTTHGDIMSYCLPDYHVSDYVYRYASQTLRSVAEHHE